MQWSDGLTVVVGTLTIFSVFIVIVMGFLNRLENRLHSDITTLTDRLDRHITDSRTEWNALNANSNARFDAMNSIIIRMLEKQGK